ncbi:hypothetical protein PV327_001273 [Microctonus hyperodae]|uniref:DALR anticodon binding domain-containing protein n=1 Tax=Microctonus hyperodae TaxID=165561 RepID=A0AA39G7V9_MICHY|nr:hypothetical protein PV327_001273 [Microctonus hyperodae]
MGFNLLQSCSKLWLPSLSSQYLDGDRFYLFLYRYDVFHKVIALVNQEKSRYGQQLVTEQRIGLTVNEDSESELTTARLHQIKYACEKLLMLHGYEINEDVVGYKYCFTTKSHGKINENVHRYVCGVVNNSAMKTKETDLTCEMYKQQKMIVLDKLNEEKAVDSDERKAWLESITEAIVIFEFLSVKPSCSISVTDSNKSITNEKSGVFVLYNAARIRAILEKFREGQLSGIYPELWDFHRIDFTKLHSQEEWEIVYHYLLEYPELIKKSVKHELKHEIYPNLICSFLISLCKKFSKFYRKERILTVGISLSLFFYFLIFYIHGRFFLNTGWI